MTPLNKSPFSHHFNILILLGAWVFKTKNPLKEKLFVWYKLFMTLLAFTGVYGLFRDLYEVLDNTKKVAWNLCVTILFLVGLTRMFQLLQRNHVIDRLRLRLHRDAESRCTPEHISINESALKELKFLQMCFYGSSIVFIPIWLLMRYFIERELAVPLYLPDVFDMEDDRIFLLMYILTAAGGVAGITLTLQYELAAFSILIQMTREYKILLVDIVKLSSLYNEELPKHKVEINPELKRAKVQSMIKKFSARQKDLIKYTSTFEICYSQSLLTQIFGVSVLIVTITVQCMMMKDIDIFGDFIYQVGYLGVVTVDMFLVCWFGTRLETLCHEIGDSVYFSHWYKMEPETQKILAMMILRSQHPPRLTAGKLMELSLNGFIHRMSNVYSWLTLFRQLT